MKLVPAFIALGSNLGDRANALEFARKRLDELPGITVRGVSTVEETLPLGGLEQPRYLNQMLAIETTLQPAELLAACHQIEAEAGRNRGERWESRNLDLDLVRYDSLEIHSTELTLPHPGLADREFWRRELEELHRAGW